MQVLNRVARQISVLEDYCWRWNGKLKNVNKDPIISFGNRVCYVGRWLFQKLHGSISKKTRVVRKCKTRNCVNPLHHWCREFDYNQMTFWLSPKDKIVSEYGESSILDWMEMEVDRIERNNYLLAKVEKSGNHKVALFVRRI